MELSELGASKGSIRYLTMANGGIVATKASYKKNCFIKRNFSDLVHENLINK